MRTLDAIDREQIAMSKSIAADLRPAAPPHSGNKLQSRFYVDRPAPGQDLSKIPIGRLLGCRVLLDRIDQERTKIGRFFMADTYQHGSCTFKVLAAGPGEWVRGQKKGSSIWIEPEVKPGDICLSYHFFRSNEHPGWHQPQWLDDSAGRGRVSLDCRFVELIKTEE
jgi:hypothetical protein